MTNEGDVRVTGVFEIVKLFKWVVVGGFALGVISVILVFLPDPNLNSLGEGLKALAQIMSDLLYILSCFILTLIAFILGVIFLSLVVKILSND